MVSNPIAPPTLLLGQQLHSLLTAVSPLDAVSAQPSYARLQCIDTAGSWRSSATQLMRWQLPTSIAQSHAIFPRSRWVPGPVAILADPVRVYLLRSPGLDKTATANISIGEAPTTPAGFICTSVLCSLLRGSRISCLCCVPQPLGRCWPIDLLRWAAGAVVVMRLVD